MSKRKLGSSFADADNMKASIWDRDKGLCVYCKSPGYAVDHVVPRNKGGLTITANGVVACNSCNASKYNSIDTLWLLLAFQHLYNTGENLSWVRDIEQEPVRKQVLWILSQLKRGIDA